MKNSINKNLKIYAFQNENYLGERSKDIYYYANYTDINLSGSLIKNEIIENTYFDEIVIEDSTLKNITFKNVIFTDCSFFGSELEQCYFINCEFIRTSFTSCFILKSMFEDCNFLDSSTCYANVVLTSMESVSFKNCNLQELNISTLRWKTSDITIENCNLVGIELGNTNLGYNIISLRIYDTFVTYWKELDVVTVNEKQYSLSEFLNDEYINTDIKNLLK